MSETREDTLNARIELLNKRIKLLNDRIRLLNDRIGLLLKEREENEEETEDRRLDASFEGF